MSRLVMSTALFLLAANAMAEDATPESSKPVAQASAPVASVVAEPVAEVKLPDGVITEQNQLKRAVLDKSKAALLMYRPNANMPDVVNESLLKGKLEPGQKPEKLDQFIGYLPALKVLPCEKGCEGSDYEKTVANFIKGYRSGLGKTTKERGEMLVQVRWFIRRNFLARMSPIGVDEFGVSFAMEGKLVSIGSQSLMGSGTESAEDLAHTMGNRLALELLMTAGVGSKPLFLQTGDSNSTMAKVIAPIRTVTTTIDSVLGKNDVLPRIEPLTDANKNLLPAIDGIQPGEVAPIEKMAYTAGWY